MADLAPGLVLYGVRSTYVRTYVHTCMLLPGFPFIIWGMWLPRFPFMVLERGFLDSRS